MDVAVFERGLSASREKAKALIAAGAVFVNGKKAEKAGASVSEGDCLEVRSDPLKYVSRGGFKLEKAIAVFGISLEGAVCADIGASTGGFSDCMLQNGAARIYAIDVGSGQLAEVLRSDPRVINLERTNFRHITAEQLPERLYFASVDVSFISLGIILPVLKSFLSEGGRAVCLIKPQFEAGRERVGKNGVVRALSVHREILRSVTDRMLADGWSVRGLDYSPIKGPEGNIEYLAYIENDGKGEYSAAETPEQIAERSHKMLDRQVDLI